MVAPSQKPESRQRCRQANHSFMFQSTLKIACFQPLRWLWLSFRVMLQNHRAFVNGLPMDVILSIETCYC